MQATLEELRIKPHPLFRSYNAINPRATFKPPNDKNDKNDIVHLHILNSERTLPNPEVNYDPGKRIGKGPLEKFIFKQNLLSPKDYQEIARELQETLKIPIHKDLAYASNGGTHQSVWVRDMAAIAQAKRSTGDLMEEYLAGKMMNALYAAYNSHNERQKMHGLNGVNGQSNWAPEDGNANRTVMSTKFSVNDQGDLTDLDHPWGHQQLDAFGYFLNELTTLAKKGTFDLKAKDIDARAKHGVPENEESSLVGMVRMLKNVNYTDTNDLGAWESHWQKGRLSSIAAVVSGLVSVKEYMQNKSDNEIPKIDNPEIYLNRQRFEHELDQAIAQGKELIQRRLNEEILHEVPFIEGKQAARTADAAMLFMLSIADPEKIGISAQQEKKILESIYTLMGKLGFRRFADDNYMSKDWHVNHCDPEQNHNGEFGKLEKPEDAAEWSMFDPYLATVNFNIFMRSVDNLNTPDWAAFARADQHVRRALTHVTPEHFSFDRNNCEYGEDGGHQCNIITNHIKPQQVLEAHFKITDKNGNEAYMPGENVGLNWTKAAMSQMLSAGAKAATVYKEIAPKYRKVFGEFLKNFN